MLWELSGLEDETLERLRAVGRCGNMLYYYFIFAQYLTNRQVFSGRYLTSSS